MKNRFAYVLSAFLVSSLSHNAFAVIIPSTGADGALHVTTSQTLTLPTNGIFNFTTITVDAPFAPLTGVLSFARNANNTPVTLRATGDVIINGTINVSAPGYTHALGAQTGGPGGGDGGERGAGATLPTNGTGPSPGLTGSLGAGGGGGMATAGGTATIHTGAVPGAGGGAIPFPGLLTGGSGGAGGNGVLFFGLSLEGGFGGGAGGGIRIDTPGNIILNGYILANGAWGADGYSVGANTPGGGGSGGIIDLHADTLEFGSNSLLQAVGGPGGGISSIPIYSESFSSNADGGLGFVHLEGDLINIPNIDAVRVVPLPAAFWLFGTGLLALTSIRRRK